MEEEAEKGGRDGGEGGGGSGKREGTAERGKEQRSGRRRRVRRCRGGVGKWKPSRHFGRKKTDFAKELGVYGQDPTRKKGFISN